MSSDRRDTTRAGFDCIHAELFILWYENMSNSISDYLREVVIIFKDSTLDIRISFSESEPFTPLGIISSVDNEEFFIGHFLESLDNAIDSFQGREACIGEVIFA